MLWGLPASLHILVCHSVTPWSISSCHTSFERGLKYLSYDLKILHTRFFIRPYQHQSYSYPPKPRTMFLLHCANDKCALHLPSMLTPHFLTTIWELWGAMMCQSKSFMQTLMLIVTVCTLLYFFVFSNIILALFTTTSVELLPRASHIEVKAIAVTNFVAWECHFTPFRLFIDGCVAAAAGGRKTRANKARNGLHRVLLSI